MPDWIVFAKKAQESLRVANDCFAHACYNSCANRSYYAMFQIAAAALFKAGVTPSANKVTHEWVQGEFSRVFIWQNKRFPKLRGLLEDVQRVRNLADYSSEDISEKRAKRALEKAVSFVELVSKEVEA